MTADKERLAADLELVVLNSDKVCVNNFYYHDTITNVLVYGIYGYIASQVPAKCNLTKINEVVRKLVKERYRGEAIAPSIINIINIELGD